MIKTDVVIIGAGPVGLFAIHQLGIKGLKAEVIDNLDKAGGQCIELYPDKPIYDIPALSECNGKSLTDDLLKQVKPFKTNFHFNERVQEVKEENGKWKVKTNKDKEFLTPNIIIAGGVGSFEPRKLPLKELEKFEGRNVFYSISNKELFKNKKIAIFGGGASALDWSLELSKTSKVTYKDFKGNSKTIEVENGLSVMEGAIQNEIPGIDADCGGAMACSTCHVYVKDEWFNKIPKAEEAEVDMIDMAYEPKKNSRLSCQIIVSDVLDGLEVTTPEKQS